MGAQLGAHSGVRLSGDRRADEPVRRGRTDAERERFNRTPAFQIPGATLSELASIELQFDREARSWRTTRSIRADRRYRARRRLFAAREVHSAIGSPFRRARVRGASREV